VLMALKPREEIGAEVHELDQFFRVEEGGADAVLDVSGRRFGGLCSRRPAGAKHNIINTAPSP